MLRHSFALVAAVLVASLVVGCGSGNRTERTVTVTGPDGVRTTERVPAKSAPASSSRSAKRVHYYLVPGYASETLPTAPTVHKHAPQLRQWARAVINEVAVYEANPSLAALRQLFNSNQQLANEAEGRRGDGPTWAGEIDLAESDIYNGIMLIGHRHQTAGGKEWLNRGATVARLVLRTS